MISFFGKKRKKDAIAFINYDVWYRSLETRFSKKPDVESWRMSLSDKYRLSEVTFYGDFSKMPNEESEKIQAEGWHIIDNWDETLKQRNNPEQTMLNDLYRRMYRRAPETIIVFGRNLMLLPVISFLRTQFRKKVILFTVTGAGNSVLEASADEVRQVPTELDSHRECVSAIIDNFNCIESDKSGRTVRPTFLKTVEFVSNKYKLDPDAVREALQYLIDGGYFIRKIIPLNPYKKITILKPDWDKLIEDGLWRLK